MMDERETAREIGTKRCKDCGEIKPLTEFTANKEGAMGRVARCKPCHWTRYGPRQNAQRRTEEGRAKLSALRKARARTDATRSREVRHAAKYREKYPEKAAAKRALRAAIERGEVTRPKQCERCGAEPPHHRDGRSTIQGHHHDYSQPLLVEWLCPLCHASEHLPTPPAGETP